MTAYRPNRRVPLRSLPGGRRDDTRQPSSDEDLIEAVVRGDRAMASELYDRLLPVVDRTLYRVFGRREADHADLIQATFEQIVLTLVRRRYARACGLSSWASTLASHVGLKALRTRRRERAVVDRTNQNVPDPEAPASLERTLGVRSELERVRGHLAAMKPERAEAVFLHDVLGHDLAEIAVLTGVSVAAAQSRLSRGRRELAERLGADVPSVLEES